MSFLRKILSGIAFLVVPVLKAWVPDPGGVWPDGIVPVAFEFAATAPNRSVAWDVAAGEALAAWNGHLQRVQLTTTPANGSPWWDNGRNELFFDDKFYGEALPSGVLAVTGVTLDRNQRVEADIVFNRNEKWGLYHGVLQSGSVDFRRVVVHELGHLLGLDHPDEAGQPTSAIMNSTVGNVEVPAADDQAGVHVLYDRGAGGPPVILGLSEGITVKQGAAARFGVVAGGRGPLSYRWRRNGSDVPEGALASLILRETSMADAGDYTVVVSNSGGAVTSQPLRLTIEPAIPPTLDVSFPEASVTAGQDWSVGIRVRSGDYPMRFEWKKNGGSVRVTDFADLTIKDVQFSDAGNYTLTATNAAGSATSAVVRLSVAPGSPPRFRNDPPSGAFATGVGVTLMANSGASGPVIYQWKKDGVDISGARAGSLFLSSFQAVDAGSYTVTVTNAFGSVTSGAGVLRILPSSTGLQISADPAPVSEYIGAKVSFYVTAVASGQLSYRWFKDGVPVSDSPPASNPTRVSGSRSPSLTLYETNAQDAGIYTVEISNTSGTVVSRGARLTLFVAGKPVFTRHPAPHTVANGGVVRLGVVMRPYAAGAPSNSDLTNFVFQWYKNGQSVAGQTSSGYSFNAQAADAGKYFVRVSSPGGVSDSETVDVVVSSGVAPILTEHPTSEFYDQSNPEEIRLASVAWVIRMRRTVVADTFVWKIGDQIVSTTQSPFDSTVVPGVYTLTVTRNGISETSRPFTIGFQTPIVPIFASASPGRTVDLGEKFQLSVTAITHGPATFQWFRDGTPIPGAISSELVFPSFAASQTGKYHATVSTASGLASSEPASIDLRSGILPVLLSEPGTTVGTVGFGTILEVSAVGGSIRYQWLKNGQPIEGATDRQLFLNGSLATAGSYTVVVSNGSGSVTSRVAQVTLLVAERSPDILFQPTSQSAPLGGDVTLVVGADGAPLPNRYQWRKDGVDIPGATDAELRLRGLQATSAGIYTVVAYNTWGSATSQPAVLTIDPAGRLVNLATRANVGVGGNILIAGFVVGGNKPRSLLIRGVGDQLSEFGVPGVLRNPVLKLFDAKAQLVATSDDWASGYDEDPVRRDRVKALENAARETGAFPLRADTRDAALIATLAPGSYSALVTGAVNTTGVALVEIYELGKPDSNRLINLSSRALVGTGAGILIPGLVLNGQAPRRLLIRAVGPGLKDFGVADALENPVMTVYREGNVVAENDNWGEQADGAKVAQTAVAVGAFSLKPGSRDAALVLDLAPGAYSVLVSGVGGSTGVALVEVYEVVK